MIYNSEEKSLTIKSGGKVDVQRNEEWPNEPWFVMVIERPEESVTLLD